MGPTEMGKTLAVLSGKSNLREEGTVFCDCACMFIVCWTTLGCRTGWEDACIGFWRCSGSPVSHWSQLCSGTATCPLIQGMHGVPLAHRSRQEHSFASAYIIPYLKCFAVPNVQVSNPRKRRAGISAWEQTDFWGLAGFGFCLHVWVLSRIGPIRACSCLRSWSRGWRCSVQVLVLKCSASAASSSCREAGATCSQVAF